jgi:hypothetical protein
MLASEPLDDFRHSMTATTISFRPPPQPPHPWYMASMMFSALHLSFSLSAWRVVKLKFGKEIGAGREWH